MASIISSGIGSGLDIAGIVQQLVAAEGQPVQARIGQQEARTQAKLSAFGSLKATLSDFRDKLAVMKDLNSFLVRQAQSANEDLFTVSVDGAALPSRYSVEVVQLAQAQKLTSGAFTASDAVVGTGTLTIAVGSESFDIEITDQNNTLSGIRNAINVALDNKGVAATIVNADAGSYLILAGENTGVSQALTITQSGGDGGLAALEYDPGNGLNALTQTVAAQDAQVRIDGFDVVSDNNVISGAIEGVTVYLGSAAPGQAADLLIENDEEAARKTVQDFVESYNKLVDIFDKLTNYDAESDLAAPLLGDATVRGIRARIRRELSTAVVDIDAPFKMLSEVGIQVQLDGKLEVKDETLSSTLAGDFSKFGQLFANSDGFAVRLFDLVDNYLDSDGIIETRSKGLNRDIEGYNDQRDTLNQRLTSLETRLLRQFNALDSLLGQLSSTSNFLAQQLNNLPGVTFPNNKQ
jgi:flagellar hook-associated protein 2